MPKKKNGDGRKKRGNAGTPPRHPQQKTGKKKKGRKYRKWDEGDKQTRDELIKGAADRIIKERENNPKNKPGEKPKVPNGAFQREAQRLQKSCKDLKITDDDIQNKVRAIDRAQEQELRKQLASSDNDSSTLAPGIPNTKNADAVVSATKPSQTQTSTSVKPNEVLPAKPPPPSTSAVAPSNPFLSLRESEIASKPPPIPIIAASKPRKPSLPNRSATRYAAHGMASITPQTNIHACSYDPCSLSGQVTLLEECSAEGCTRKAHLACHLVFRGSRGFLDQSTSVPPLRCRDCEIQYQFLQTINSNSSQPEVSMTMTTSESAPTYHPTTSVSKSNGLSPRNLETTLKNAVLPTQTQSVCDIDESTCQDISTSQPPALPITSHYLLDSSQQVSSADIGMLSAEMKLLGNEVIIRHQTSSKLKIKRDSFARLQPDEYLNDEIMNFIGKGVLEKEVSDVLICPSYFMGGLYKLDRDIPAWRRLTPSSEVFDEEEDVMAITWNAKTDDNAVYDINRVHSWLKLPDGKDSIFDLKMLFIPINKGLNHWIFIMVNIEEKSIGLWDSFGRQPDNKQYLLVIQQFLFDFSVSLYGSGPTGAKEEWDKCWNINDHSDEWPNQLDGYSCGIFALLGMHCLIHKKPLTQSTFSQERIIAENVRMKIAAILWSHRHGNSSSSIDADLHQPSAIQAAPIALTLPAPAPAPKDAPVENIVSSEGNKSNTSEECQTQTSSRNKGGRPTGTTKKNKEAKAKALREARNYVVLEYAEALATSKNGNRQRVPKGTLSHLVKRARELFDVGNEFDVPSSTISNRMKSGNLEVHYQGEEPIVLALEQIMISLIIQSATNGNHLRVGQAIALCNEILKSSPTLTEKVIKWKTDRGIYDPEGWLLGYRWWKSFRKRNENIITATVGRKFAKNRADHCNFDAFEVMYSNWENALVLSGNAVKLDTPVHMDKEGNVVPEEDATGHAVTHSIIRPSNVFVLDETGSNTNGKSDCRNGGEKLVGPCGEVAADIISGNDSHYTITPISDLTGCLRAMQMIFKGEKLPASVSLGLDALVELEGDGSVEANMGPGKRFPGCNITNANGVLVPIIYDCSENASQTEKTFLNLFKQLDKKGIGSRGVDENDTPYMPCLILDGHSTRLCLGVLEYWCEPLNRWVPCLGVVYGTNMWQFHDNDRENGHFKTALSKFTHKYLVQKALHGLPQQLRPSEVPPIVEKATNESFNNIACQRGGQIWRRD